MISLGGRAGLEQKAHTLSSSSPACSRRDNKGHLQILVQISAKSQKNFQERGVGWYTTPNKNYFSTDPFADASKGDDLLPAGTEEYIHIRIQKRDSRKTLTTVQGIADDYDKKKLVKAFKKKFACNGTVIEHPEYGEVIQLQGDQRKNICQFLIEIGLAKDDQLKVHGF